MRSGFRFFAMNVKTKGGNEPIPACVYDAGTSSNS
jgi:hypothetical protein